MDWLLLVMAALSEAGNSAETPRLTIPVSKSPRNVHISTTWLGSSDLSIQSFSAISKSSLDLG